MLMTLFAATVFTAALASSSGSAEGPCVVQFANGSAHSSIAQHFAVAFEQEVRGHSFLRLARASGDFDIEFYLVGAPANDIRSYPSNDRFRVFYVLKYRDDKFDSAAVLNCSGRGEECAASAARRRAETCARMPNKSFKPMPLRGTA